MSEEKFLIAWEKKRKKGRGRFILELSIRNSVLIVAASFLLRFILFEYRNRDFISFIKENINLLVIFFAVIFVSSSTGAFIRWKNDESRYKAMKDNHMK